MNDRRKKMYDYSLYRDRRSELVQQIKNAHPHVSKGIVAIFANIESKDMPFQQDSTFYYFTGLAQEAGAVLICDLAGDAQLYIPTFQTDRSVWMHTDLPITQENAHILEVSSVNPLGDASSGYSFYSYFNKSEYKNILALCAQIAKEQGSIFTCMPQNTYEYIQQRHILDRITLFDSAISHSFIDIANIVAHMRRKKDSKEIELLYNAIHIAQLAQQAAASVIAPGVNEAEVQASLEYMMIGSHARPSFSSIVASGKNSTVLHYHANTRDMEAGDVVVVDIGARSHEYCSDITRTYPVSGRFSKRQQELYSIVLDVQEYIAGIAQPGYWLSYAKEADRSLNHLAKKYLKDKGYEEYFPHGIGHFIGLDVHDVGDYTEPLHEGDVITIEPGIYIPHENIGIRIEDNYWIVKNGAICLSEDIEKRVDAVQELVQDHQNSAQIRKTKKRSQDNN